MVEKINEIERLKSHVVIREAVKEVFNSLFTDELIQELTKEELILLSEALAHRLTKQVGNEVLLQTYYLTKEE